MTRNIIEVFWWDEDGQSAGLLCECAGRDAPGVYAFKTLQRDRLQMNGEQISIDDVRAAAAVRISGGQTSFKAGV